MTSGGELTADGSAQRIEALLISADQIRQPIAEQAAEPASRGRAPFGPPSACATRCSGSAPPCAQCSPVTSRRLVAKAWEVRACVHSMQLGPPSHVRACVRACVRVCVRGSAITSVHASQCVLLCALSVVASACVSARVCVSVHTHVRRQFLSHSLADGRCWAVAALASVRPSALQSIGPASLVE